MFNYINVHDTKYYLALTSVGPPSARNKPTILIFDDAIQICGFYMYNCLISDAIRGRIYQ